MVYVKFQSLYRMPDGPERISENMFQLLVGSRYYMYPDDNFKFYLDAALGMGIGSFGNFVMGLVVKLFDFLAFGVRSSISYTNLFTLGLGQGVTNDFFDPAYPGWAVTFYTKDSVPLKKQGLWSVLFSLSRSLFSETISEVHQRKN